MAARKISVRTLSRYAGIGLCAILATACAATMAIAVTAATTRPKDARRRFEFIGVLPTVRSRGVVAPVVEGRTDVSLRHSAAHGSASRRFAAAESAPVAR